MSCSGCSSGRGCGTATKGLPPGCRNNGSCGTGGCNVLNVFDWLSDIQLPEGQETYNILEIRFKNSRKEFYKNVSLLPLATGDTVAVEAGSGHDIGIVSLTGELVKLQMKKKNVSPQSEEVKKIYRKARPADIDKWKEAISLEKATMKKARELAITLKLEMKISDVEYQGDKSKATFYYTAEDRVDFRELIKRYAEAFRVRIEMRQIGYRQEAAKLGGIGSCGRELCCSTWLTDFRTVSTSAARYQQLSLNPAKLAGQCGKLKCCLNYELDNYMDSLKEFPDQDIKLKSDKGILVHQKTDIFKRLIWYALEQDSSHFFPFTVEKAIEAIKLNVQEKQIILMESIVQPVEENKKEVHDYENVVGQDSLDRFNKDKNEQKKQNRHHSRKQNSDKRFFQKEKAIRK
jgi:cell fate regulator YaaT (PSP1 superfamily)